MEMERLGLSLRKSKAGSPVNPWRVVSGMSASAAMAGFTEKISASCFAE